MAAGHPIQSSGMTAWNADSFRLTAPVCQRPHMDSKLVLLLSICLPLSLTSCEPGEPTGDGKPVTFATVCDKENNGKRVTLEGFLDYPDRFNLKASTIVMRLQAAPTRSSTAIGARLKLNADSNTVISPPDKYNERDLKAITHDGKSTSYKTRLKVTGTMAITDSLDTRQFACFLDSARIEVAGVAATK